jgi:AbrB family looped-hinge helix DNA binding protein
MMPTSTVTSKGQVTIPASIRAQLGIEPGTRLSFTPYDGAFMVRPSTDSLASLEGVFSNNGIHANIEDMNDAVAHAFATAGLGEK